MARGNPARLAEWRANQTPEQHAAWKAKLTAGVRAYHAQKLAQKQTAQLPTTPHEK